MTNCKNINQCDNCKFFKIKTLKIQVIKSRVVKKSKSIEVSRTN